MPARAVPSRVGSAALLLPFLIAGCEAGTAGSEAGVPMDPPTPEAGPAPGPADVVWEDGAQWRVEEVLRIGVLDGAGPDIFGRIGAIEVNSDGTILIFDDLAKEVRTFSSNGVHQSTLGRAGEGPGEFENVLGMALGPGGDLWIVDSRNARYTVLGSEDDPVFLTRASRVVRRPWLGGFDRDGLFYDRASGTSGGDFTELMFKVGPDGEVADTFALPHLEAPTVQLNGDGVSVRVPFAPRPLRAWDPRGGVWQALSSEYRITNVRLDGDTAQILSREIEPAPLSPFQQDSVAGFIRDIESRYGRSVEPRLRPAVHPLIRWFIQDDADHLWVCATGPDPCTELDVFGPAGAFLGTVALPEPILDSPLPVIRDGRLHAAVEGQLGAPQLFVGRIVVP